MAKLTTLLLLSLFFSAALAKTFNNDWYKVVVDETHGYWGAATGADHPGTDPVDGEKEILWGGVDEDPFTVFFSVYSPTTSRTYTNNHNLAYLNNPDWTILSVDRTNTVSASTYVQEFDAEYEEDGEAVEEFTVKITYSVVGTSFETAAIHFFTEIENTGTSALQVSLRWQMDYNLMGDDGCAFATVLPDSGRYVFEKEWNAPKYDQYLISPNGLSTAFYEAYGPVQGKQYPNLEDATVPVKIQFASYTANTLVAYDTQIDPDDQVVFSNIQDDSVVMLYWDLPSIPAGQTSDPVRSAISSVYVDTDNNGVIVCNDGWACTYDHIAVQAGHVQQCLHIPQDYYCDDSNPCTVDSCDQANYAYFEEGKYFDEASGCVHLPKDCSDGIFCTLDVCDEATGDCDSSEAMDCSDGWDCTDDYCDEKLGGCVNTPNDYYCQTEGAEAGNLCLNIWCDEFEGCQHSPVDCDDQIGCTNDECNPDEGCYFVADEANCNDHVACTVDICDKDLGKCRNEADDERCPPEGEAYDPCMDYYCDIVHGCKSTPKVCDGPDTACLYHMCISGECVAFAMDHLCNDTVYCTDERCANELGKCESIPNDGNCDDGKICTYNWCDPINDCQYEAIVCDDHVACTTDDHCSEEAGGCVFTENHEICDDDEKLCTVDTCDKEKGCQREYDNSLCNDDNACTTDICVGANGNEKGCIHVEMVCDDDIFCTKDYCEEGECVFEIIEDSCNDKIDCTQDSCDTDNLERCVNTPYDSNCNDGVECTIDSCDALLGCLFKPSNKSCDDGFDCTTNWCHHTEGCKIELDNDLCDDNIACTKDECTATMGCTFTPQNSECNDEIICHINTCGENGCETKFDVSACDDGIPCTKDTCDEYGCHNVPQNSWCDDDVACTVDICNASLTDTDYFCVHTTDHIRCDDGRNCSIEYCDLTMGCIIDESNCPEDEDCERCVNCKSGLSRLVADDMEDGSGDLIIMTRNHAVLPYTVASSTENLTKNLKIKGSGAVVLGKVEHLAADDGLVIGHGSAFRLVPSQETAETPCNELNRGLIRLVEEEVAGRVEGTFHKIDEMYICLANVGSYEWKKLLN